jgi:ParB family chromosome partitioning protein
MLTEHEITASDRRMKFVTLKAYEKAGGTVRRDLFSTDEDGVFIDDVVLLESLVAKKLEKPANAIRKEGWKWVEIRAHFDREEWSDCGRRFPELVPLSADEQSELDSLIAEEETLSAIEEPDDDQQARLDAVIERIDALNDRDSVWTPESMTIAGAVVTLGNDGKAAIHCGYVRPEDAPRKTRAANSVTLADGTVIAPPRDTHPATLIESLTAHRSAGLSVALLEHPEVALAVTVHVLALQVLYNVPSGDTALQITARTASLRRAEGSPATAVIDAARERWCERIPADPFPGRRYAVRIAGLLRGPDRKRSPAQGRSSRL